MLNDDLYKAAIEFLRADQKMQDIGRGTSLSKMRVNGDLLSRGEVADLLHAERTLERARKRKPK